MNDFLPLLLPCKNIVGSAALAEVCGLQVLKLLTMVITLVMSLIKEVPLTTIILEYMISVRVVQILCWMFYWSAISLVPSNWVTNDQFSEICTDFVKIINCLNYSAI